jgi:lysophospholipase L1-like esterase
VLGRRELGLAAGALLLGAAAATLPPAATPIARLDLPWWRERHAAKLAELRHAPVALLFLGDSITQNWESAGPPAWRDFRPAWSQFYGDRHAVNLGFKGDTTANLLWRLRNGELDAVAPKAAVILIGANNLGRVHWPAADTVLAIAAVVAEVRRRLPPTQVLLLGVLPSDRGDWATRTTGAVNRALAARYAGGAEAGVRFLDVGAAFMRDGRLDRSLFYDPLLTPPEPVLHPTPDGQRLLSAAIEPTLAGLLGDRRHPL